MPLIVTKYLTLYFPTLYIYFQILHISSKLAHIAQLQGDIEKAKTGFIWTLAKIEECKNNMPDDIDVKELWALTTNW